MNEVEWFAARTPEVLFSPSRMWAVDGARRRRLFACECCRPLFREPTGHRGAEDFAALELFAEGVLSGEECLSRLPPPPSGPAGTAGQIMSRIRNTIDNWPRRILMLCNGKYGEHLEALGRLIEVGTLVSFPPDPYSRFEVYYRQSVFCRAGGTGWGYLLHSEEELRRQPGGVPAGMGEIKAADAAVFRDIFGNPFRPAEFDQEWLTDTVVSMARGMYESRDFSPMPILADALQDSGCDGEDVLSHCRDEKGTHVRGCWVVDLVLGKS